jgi:hypothetical protein
MNSIENPLSGLKNVLQKLHEAFQGFGSGFTEPNAKLDADTLIDFANHRIQNETRSCKSTHLKTMRVHSPFSRARLMK